jgi:hypothetical protein
MKLLTPLVIIIALTLSGCSAVPKLKANLDEFESLGVTKIIVTGKFSHTDYTVTRENGIRTATINHTNAWVPQVQIIRETKE